MPFLNISTGKAYFEVEVCGAQGAVAVGFESDRFQAYHPLTPEADRKPSTLGNNMHSWAVYSNTGEVRSRWADKFVNSHQVLMCPAVRL